MKDILDKASNFDIIGIDESNLFTDLREIVLILVEKERKKVIVSGLNGDYLRKPFGQFNDLIPYCDTITKLSPFCQNCCGQGIIRPAHFSQRIEKSKRTEKDSLILIGGKETYLPVCRECFKDVLVS